MQSVIQTAQTVGQVLQRVTGKISSYPSEPGTTGSNDPSNIVTENVIQKILVFRTITTMLSQIQKTSIAFNPVHCASPTSEQRGALKILDALATLIVMEHEIVAVVANQETEAELKVIACVQLEDHTPPTGKDEPERTTPSLAQRILKQWSRTFVISENTSKDRQTSNTLPTLNDPELPDSLESSCSESELMEYVNKRQ